MKQFFFLPACLALLFVLGCHKNDIKSGGQPTLPIISTSPSPITASIQGNVFDENDRPVSGVSITVGSINVTTDFRGYFRIDNASLDKNASLLMGQFPGYFKIIKTFAATSGVNYQRIKLIKKNLIGTISGSAGGTISLNDGSSIVLPANGIVKKSDNSLYNGAINVYAANIDPSVQDISLTIPGSLMANDSSGIRVALHSYGMLAVELESSSSEPLQIASGKTASLNFNIPSSLQNTAPSSIALWYIDDSSGLWKQEGSATKSGNTYTGHVSHFSFWNCDDIVINPMYLTLRLMANSNTPLQYALVQIASGKYGDTYGFTDSLGQVSGVVPSNESLSLNVIGYDCGAILFSKQIGPFSKSTDLGTLLIDTTKVLVTVTGKLVDCDGQAVKKGTAIIYYGYVKYTATSNELGEFSIALLKCGTITTSIEVIGADVENSQQGQSYNFNLSSPQVNVGNINTCGSISYQYVTYSTNDHSFTFTDSNSTITDSLTIFNGKGGISINAQANNYGTYGAVGWAELAYISFNDLGSAGVQPLPGAWMPGYTPNDYTVLPASNFALTNYAYSKGQFFDGNFSGNLYFYKYTGTLVDTVHCVMNLSFHVRRNW